MSNFSLNNADISNSVCSLTILILTYNEEKHIERCIKSLQSFAQNVIIVDSFSTDKTVELAKSLGAKVYPNPWINHAKQLNWGLDNCPINTQWVMRLDADEIVTPELAKYLQEQLISVPIEITGMTVNRQIHFLGKWIKHGDIYPVRTLRAWRNGQGRCEDRWMDEHVLVEGNIQHINADIADINLNNITWWTTKHNHYASREAVDLLMSEAKDRVVNHDSVMSRQARIKRWIKHSVYAHLPLGLRALVYFLYRYCVRLGFLDGWQGLVFHTLQGFWYRFLVDVKVYELRKLMAERGQSLVQVVKDEFGYDISSSTMR